MRLHRRALFPGDGWGAGDCEGYGYGCHAPPPVPSSLDAGPGPSPSSSSPFPPRGIPPSPCPPGFPPSPAPAHNGRRDQGGMQGYGPPPPGVGGADDHNRQHLVKYALIAAGVIAFVSLILLGVSVAVRRRQVRRRRQTLLAPSIPAGAGGDGGDDHEGGGGGGGGGVVHHVWNIRTVGLDDASIASIAVTRYRAGAGLLGAADCSVCLGEFQDGELVRLLPKCAHAFHAPCIDTWLRAHVNCPICRSDVLDPAVTTASGGGGESSSAPPADPDANASGAADRVAAASDAAPDHEEEESDGQEAPPTEQDQQEQSSVAEPPPQLFCPPPQLFCPPPRNMRRAASMDAVAVSTATDVAALDRLPEEAPEEEQIGGRRKRGTCAKASGSGHWNYLSADRPASSGVPRSFFSRHCRARSSVLPL